MAKFTFDGKRIESASAPVDESVSTRELADAVKAINRSVTQLNWALSSLHQQLADHQANLEAEVSRNAQTLH